MFLEDRRGGSVHVPAHQHVDGLGDLRRNVQNTSTGLFSAAAVRATEAASKATTARRRYRPDADALGEAVVGLDVLVQLLDGSGSQRRAVVGLVDVQHHCRIKQEVSVEPSRTSTQVLLHSVLTRPKQGWIYSLRSLPPAKSHARLG